MHMKINIKGNEIELKNSIRALMLYEEILGKTFKGESLNDMIIFYYCIVVTSNMTLNISIDDFIDAIDEDSNLLESIALWYVSVLDLEKSTHPSNSKKK